MPRTASHDQPNVTVGQIVPSAGFAHCIREFVQAHGQIEQDCLGGKFQSFQVLFQFEHTTVIKTDSLKDSVSVQQAMIENGHFGIRLIDKFSVQVNFHPFPSLMNESRALGERQEKNFIHLFAIRFSTTEGSAKVETSPI